jgi:apolipoprotein N-acyltransferase
MKSASAPAKHQEALATRMLAARDRLARHAVVAGPMSGLLLWTSFPPLEWNGLAWLALAPLFWLITLREARFQAYMGAWLGGLAFWLLALQWLTLLDVGGLTGWVVMAFAFSLWWPLFLLVSRLAVFRLRIPLMMAAPIVWVGLEYARAYFLSGFPWYYLAHSQFRRLYLIQIADFASSLGISLLIAIVNAMVVDLATLPLFGRSRSGIHLNRRQYVRLCVVTCLLGTTLCYGAIRVSSARFADGPRLALLQSNIEQKHKNPGRAQPIIAEFTELVDRALMRRERPDLIIWPETAYPYNYITVDPAVTLDALERQVHSFAPKWSGKAWLELMGQIAADLRSWTDRAGVPMLVGTIRYDHVPGSNDVGASGLRKFNAAILFEPHRQLLHFYHKMHLVPFGEYFPLIESLPWLRALTPYRGEKLQSLSFGHEPVSLPLGPYRLAVSICFEDTIPHVIRRSFADLDAGLQPDVLINLSNDGWFHGSPELDMHLASGVFRAIENRVPLARAVNTGLSALVDGNGEIREALAKESKGVLSVTVPLDERTSYYSKWGDWLGLTCLAVSIGLVPMGWLRSRRSRSVATNQK